MDLVQSCFNYHFKINSGYSLINNTLTGALDVIENDIWDLVQKRKFGDIERYPISNLIERGYFYSDLKKEFFYNINLI